jgi:uncharacterized protein GlcG (DUF336 family)
VKRSAVVAAALAAIPTPASGQPPATLDNLTALVIVTTCANHAAVKKQSEAIVVVDNGGNVIAALRMDGNGSGIFDFALAKAQAAAAWGFSTAEMLNSARGTPGFERAPHIVIVPGGLPIFTADGKTQIGAVGVSGEAPADDAECAQAGIKAAKLRSARS